MDFLFWAVAYFAVGSVFTFFAGVSEELKGEEDEAGLAVTMFFLWPITVVFIPYTLGKVLRKYMQTKKLEERVDGGKN